MRTLSAINLVANLTLRIIDQDLSLAALDKYGVTGQISYVSTGGGAFLEFLEGATLPAVAALEARARNGRR